MSVFDTKVAQVLWSGTPLTADQYRGIVTIPRFLRDPVKLVAEFDIDPDLVPFIITGAGGNLNRQPFKVYIVDKGARRIYVEVINPVQDIQFKKYGFVGNGREASAWMRTYLSTVGTLARGVRPLSNNPRVMVNPLGAGTVVVNAQGTPVTTGGTLLSNPGGAAVELPSASASATMGTRPSTVVFGILALGLGAYLVFGRRK